MKKETLRYGFFKNGNTIITVFCSVITVLVIVCELLLNKHYKSLSARLEQLEYILQEKQTTYNQAGIYKDLYLSYASAKTEIDKLILLELMKETDDSLTIYLLESIGKHENDEVLKNKAIEVLTYKELENIHKIKLATSTKEITTLSKPTHEEQAINRLLLEDNQGRYNQKISKINLTLASSKHLALARAYYSINEYKEACDYFNKIDVNGLPDSLVDHSSLLLGRKSFFDHDYIKAARNFQLALSSVN